METAKKIIQDKETQETKQRPHARMLKPEEIDRLPGREMTEKRTRNGKVFSLGGNLFQSVLFFDPVHYMDKKTGQWEEIDNTLISKASKSKETYLANRNNGNIYVRLLPSSSDQMIALENEDGQMLSWTLEGVQNIAPRRAEKKMSSHDGRDQRRKVLNKTEGKAIYENILPDTDVICTVLPDGFKDEIIFKSPEAVRPVSFLLSAPNLILSCLENGGLDASTPTGETVFHLPAPLLTDKTPERMTGKVETALEKMEGEYLWRLTYKPDLEWISGAAFPVTLDPLVFTRQHSDAIEDNFVTSTAPNTVQPYAGTGLRISYNSGTYGTSKAYIKFLDANMPPIDSSNYVTKAYLSVALKTTPTVSASVYVKEVLGNWGSQTITYNTQPAVNTMPLDYVYMETTHGAGSRYSYDISNLVRKWYAGTNYGVMLESITDTSLELYSSDYAYAKPYVAINYVSLAGMEDYLAYESQSVGRAGTGHVSLYNGNLIFEHQDTSCNGNLLPVSINHVYNSCYYDEDQFSLGYGWRMSIQQSLHKQTIPGPDGDMIYYVYTDDDGTQHHFKQNSGVWEDQSGLELTLVISGSTATIKDKGDNALLFDLPTAEYYGIFNAKMLKSITDACGNTATINVDENYMPTDVQDGAGRHTTFFTMDRLENIWAPGNSDPVTFEYSFNQLSKIIHEDGMETTYVYNEQGLLESATNHDGLKVTYQYYTARKPYRVKKVTISNGGITYNGRKYEYGDCLTTITDLYNDGSGTLVEGKKLFYHFNDYGNVVSVNDQLGYAAFAKYNNNLPVNHPEVVSKLQRAVCNLLPNHNFEASDSWSTVAYGGTGTFGYATDQKYLGTRSMKVDKTNSDGNMCVYMNFTTLEVGKTYTLSGYIRSSGSANCYATAYCGVNWYDGDKVTSVGDWTRIFTTFTATATSATLYFITMGGPGTVWIDCAQLEESAVANRYNMLINGDFSFNSGAHPTGWLANASNTATDIVYTTYDGVKPEGLSANTMRMYGTGRTKYAGIFQDISQSGNTGDVFIAGGWSMNHSKPRKGEDFRYNIRVAFLNTSGTRENTPSIEWSEEWSGWQFAAGPVIAPCNYTSIRFNVDYERNINYTDFDGFFLHKEEFGQTFAYDDKNNITAVTNLASKQSHATYDAFNNMLTYRQPGRPEGVQTTLTYGNTDAEKQRHLVKTSTDPVGVTQAFEYDLKGNRTSFKIQNSGGTSFIKSTAAYTDNQNYVASQTDARGKTVTSNIDRSKGTLDSVTDPNGQTVSYAYDTLNRVTAATTAADGKTYRNEYVYTADKLTHVKHNTTSDTAADVVYNFAYDTLGNPTTVQIGSQTFSTNVYSTTGDKLLSRVEYDNGGKVSFTRDAYKRVTGIRYDSAVSDRYQYAFGANGQVAQIKDDNLSRITTLEYDAANRPMRAKQMEGTTHLYTSTLGYDAYNNLSSFKERVGSSGYETAYAYDNGNRPTAVQFGSTANQVGYAYDALGRVITRTMTVGGTNYTTSYGFEAGGQGYGSTTELVNNITQNGQNFTYTYDNVGNISSVDIHRDHGIIQTYQTYTVLDQLNGNQVYGDEALTKPVSAQIADFDLVEAKIFYHYDNLGQLVRVDDPYDRAAGARATTWVYNYDRGGNITSKVKYACTNGALGTPLQTINYMYDATWKDKLVSYNGAAITYDGIGNPLTDGTWAYTWQAGRQLKSMVKSDGTSVNFVYNADGLRVRKTVNTTVTDYTLNGTQVVHLKKDGNNLHFFYDAQGRPAVVDFNGVKYGYVHNLQGDIVAIVDGGGNQVVEYTYDAWGRPLSKTGTKADTLGTLNPFRYRGYVYDEETGLYYLRSRYYNPVWGRFVNADSLIGKAGVLLSHNMFGYCRNNPVNRIDPSGAMEEEWYSKEAQNARWVKRRIQAYSNANRNNPSFKTVTVSNMFGNFDKMIEKKTDVSSATDSGCAMFIRCGILGILKRHGSHVYKAGMTPMFKNDLIVQGNIDDIGGPSGLVIGMILGTHQDGPKFVKHGGVYAGLHDFGNGLEPAVYSFDTVHNVGNLRPYNDNDWAYFGWHKGVVLD